MDEVKDRPTRAERIVEELVDFLRDGHSTRGDFYAAIESAKAYLRWIEQDRDRLAADNRELQDAMMVGLPPLSTSFDISKPPAWGLMHVLDWQIDRIVYRATLDPFQAQADPRTWARIRKLTFRGVLRSVRKAFDKTFPKEPPR